MKYLFKPLQRLIALLTLAGYLCLVVFGFLHIVHMVHMGTSMRDCPFSEGAHTICDMTPLEHLRSLQKSMNVNIAIAKMLLPTLVLVCIFQIFATVILKRFIIYKKREVAPMSMYQELFSQGILNPKIP